MKILRFIITLLLQINILDNAKKYSVNTIRLQVKTKEVFLFFYDQENELTPSKTNIQKAQIP
jgi:hypothetical protein